LCHECGLARTHSLGLVLSLLVFLGEGEGVTSADGSWFLSLGGGGLSARLALGVMDSGRVGCVVLMS